MIDRTLLCPADTTEFLLERETKARTKRERKKDKRGNVEHCDGRMLCTMHSWERRSWIRWLCPRRWHRWCSRIVVSICVDEWPVRRESVGRPDQWFDSKSNEQKKSREIFLSLSLFRTSWESSAKRFQSGRLPLLAGCSSSNSIKCVFCHWFFANCRMRSSSDVMIIIRVSSLIALSALMWCHSLTHNSTTQLTHLRQNSEQSAFGVIEDASCREYVNGCDIHLEHSWWMRSPSVTPSLCHITESEDCFSRFRQPKCARGREKPIYIRVYCTRQQTKAQSEEKNASPDKWRFVVSSDSFR